MTALVVFPDTDILAHTVLLAGLAEHGITGIEVGTQLPSPPPERFIKCFTLPGRQPCRRTQQCQVITQCYDVDEVRCADLARLCGAVLRAAPDGDFPVSEPCGQTGPHPYLDPDLPSMARHQVTVDWTVQSSVNP